jgi:hypothetical protein
MAFSICTVSTAFSRSTSSRGGWSRGRCGSRRAAAFGGDARALDVLAALDLGLAQRLHAGDLQLLERRRRSSRAASTARSRSTSAASTSRLAAICACLHGGSAARPWRSRRAPRPRLLGRLDAACARCRSTSRVRWLAMRSCSSFSSAAMRAFSTASRRPISAALAGDLAGRRLRGDAFGVELRRCASRAPRASRASLRRCAMRAASTASGGDARLVQRLVAGDSCSRVLLGAMRSAASAFSRAIGRLHGLAGGDLGGLDGLLARDLQLADAPVLGDARLVDLAGLGDAGALHRLAGGDLGLVQRLLPLDLLLGGPSPRPRCGSGSAAGLRHAALLGFLARDDLGLLDGALALDLQRPASRGPWRCAPRPRPFLRDAGALGRLAGGDLGLVEHRCFSISGPASPARSRCGPRAPRAPAGCAPSRSSRARRSPRPRWPSAGRSRGRAPRARGDARLGDGPLVGDARLLDRLAGGDLRLLGLGVALGALAGQFGALLGAAELDVALLLQPGLSLSRSMSSACFSASRLRARIWIIVSCSMSLRSLRLSSMSRISAVRPSASKRFEGLKNSRLVWSMSRIATLSSSSPFFSRSSCAASLTRAT